MQKSWLSLPLVLALGCAPYRPAAPVLPLAQAKVGDTAFYGPGIVAASRYDRHLLLSQPGYVTTLQVYPSGWITPINLMFEDDRTFYSAGAHRVRLISGPPETTSSASSSNNRLTTSVGLCDVRYQNNVVAERGRTPGDSIGRAMSEGGATASSQRMLWRCVAASQRGSRGLARSAAGATSSGGRWLVIVSDTRPNARELCNKLNHIGHGPVDVIDNLPEAVLATGAHRWAAYFVGAP